MAVICYMCHGKGKFEEYEITVNGKTVTVPEQPCFSCDGKGVISAPQFEGCPSVIGVNY